MTDELNFVRRQYIAAALSEVFSSIAMKRVGGNQPAWLVAMHRAYDARHQASAALSRLRDLGCPVAKTLDNH